jgi:hypothetical protein
VEDFPLGLGEQIEGSLALAVLSKSLRVSPGCFVDGGNEGPRIVDETLAQVGDPLGDICRFEASALAVGVFAEQDRCNFRASPSDHLDELDPARAFSQIDVDQHHVRVEALQPLLRVQGTRCTRRLESLVGQCPRHQRTHQTVVFDDQDPALKAGHRGDLLCGLSHPEAIGNPLRWGVPHETSSGGGPSVVRRHPSATLTEDPAFSAPSVGDPTVCAVAAGVIALFAVAWGLTPYVVSGFPDTIHRLSSRTIPFNLSPAFIGKSALPMKVGVKRLRALNSTPTLGAFAVKALVHPSKRAASRGGAHARRLAAFALSFGLVASSSGLTSIPAQAAALGAGDCVQEVSGLTGTVHREDNYCLVALKGPAVASGESGNWTVPSGVSSVDLLIVGGGGGGGRFGGGGAGAMYETNGMSVNPGASIAVAIGSGGAGYGNLEGAIAGSNGSTSSFGDLAAFGGGGGSSSPQTKGGVVANADSPGGSGGGAMASPVGDPKVTGDAGGTSPLAGPSTPGRPAGTAGLGQRNAGGSSSPVFVYLQNANWLVTTTGGASGVGLSASFWQGGGGGGAGSAGGAISWSSNGLVGKSGDAFNTSFRPGDGGAGNQTSLMTADTATALGVGEVSGSSVFFAGGGAGFANFDAATTEPKDWDFDNGIFLNYSLAGSGGLGGGGGVGDGRSVNGSIGSSNAGFENTGGGGRGAGHAGGSGVVVIRYVIPGLEPSTPPVTPEDPADDSSGSSPSEDALEESTGSSVVSRGAIGLELIGDVAIPAQDVRMEAGGTQLPPGTSYTLTFLRPEATLTSGQVGDSGAFYHLLNVPGPLSPGTYSVILRAIQPDGFVLELRRDFVVAADGTVADLGVNVVGGGPAATGPDPTRLQTTGEESAGMPLWAILLQILGLLLVVYSIRATRMVSDEELAGVSSAVRTPWEILSTPITVPGIDYVPGSQPLSQATTFADTMRELDLAVSKVIAFEIKKLRYHAAVRVIAPVRSWSHVE